MAKYVKLLEEGACAPPPGWPDEPAGPDPVRLGEGDAQEWSKLCQQIVCCAQSSPGLSTEIFLCLLGDEFVRLLDRRSIERLLVLARNYSWGARVFLVTGRQVSTKDILREGKESVEPWMRTVLEAGAYDLLQIDYDPWQPHTLSLEQLRQAADLAKERQNLLASLEPVEGPWKCALPNPTQDLRARLFPSLVQYVSAPEQAPNLVFLVDSLSPAQQVKTVQSALSRFPGRRFVIATLKGASTRLLDLCANYRTRPIELRGDFELFYLLLRLNEAGRHALRGFSIDDPAELPAPYLFEPPVERIPLNGDRAFQVVRPGDLPTILVTSGFNPKEIDQCVEAAHDVGWFVKLFPPGLQVRVEPAITLETLFHAFRQFPDFNVWIHLGHGHKSAGFMDTTGTWAAAEKWLQAFDGRDFRLHLAMFLSCQSAPAAEDFARAGVRLTIGFRNNVEASKCRELAVEVLDALFQKGGSPLTLLKGFRLGWNRLDALQEIQSQAVAYFPVQAV